MPPFLSKVVYPQTPELAQRPINVAPRWDPNSPNHTDQAPPMMIQRYLANKSMLLSYISLLHHAICMHGWPIAILLFNFYVLNNCFQPKNGTLYLSILSIINSTPLLPYDLGHVLFDVRVHIGTQTRRIISYTYFAWTSSQVFIIHKKIGPSK